jgi:7-cyano-7-deazaguanine synthase
LAPLRRLDKHDLIQAYPAIPWRLTFSCIAPAGRMHCGRCNKCDERQRAFSNAGQPDPTRYAA